MGDWRSFDIANPTEEHAMIREMVRDFVKEEVEPQALEFDRDEKFNLELFRKLGDYGLLGITVDEEYGGAAWMPQQLPLSTRSCLIQTPTVLLISPTKRQSTIWHSMVPTLKRAIFPGLCRVS